MGLEVTLPWPQEPSNDHTSPHPHILLLLEQFWYYLTICAQVSQVVYLFQVFRLKCCMHFSSPPCVIHVVPTPSSVITLICGEENKLWSPSLCSVI